MKDPLSSGRSEFYHMLVADERFFNKINLATVPHCVSSLSYQALAIAVLEDISQNNQHRL